MLLYDTIGFNVFIFDFYFPQFFLILQMTFDICFRFDYLFVLNWFCSFFRSSNTEKTYLFWWFQIERNGLDYFIGEFNKLLVSSPLLYPSMSPPPLRSWDICSSFYRTNFLNKHYQRIQIKVNWCFPIYLDKNRDATNHKYINIYTSQLIRI